MRGKKLICCLFAAAAYLSMTACGEPIEPTDSDPLFSMQHPDQTASGTGSMIVESVSRRTTATTASSTTTTARTRPETVTVSFLKKEILAAANLPEMYLNYGYMDVDGLSVNYGDISVQRDNGIYTIPQGFGLHYITQIDVANVPKGKTVILSGSIYIKVLTEVPVAEQSSAADESSVSEDSVPDESSSTESSSAESSKEENSKKEESSKSGGKDKKPETVKVPKLEKTAKFTIVQYVP